MIKQSTNVVHEQGVKKLSNFLLVGKVQSPLEWNPVVMLVSQNQVAFGCVSTYQTPFKCMGPILTTWRTFSLFSMPSRLPLVMPATLSNFVPLIMWLSAATISLGLSYQQSYQSSPSLLATQIPRASTWKHRLPSSSQRVAVTLGFIPGGATWPVVSKPLYWLGMPG